jgi:RHS repeat-associated protein
VSDHRSECRAMAAPGAALVGDPIDVITGANLDRVVDFRVADDALPLVWRRSYDSRRNTDDRGLGWGHAHELDHWLEWDLDGILYVRPHDDSVGFEHAFTDGLVGMRDGVELERVDAAHYVIRAHGEPDRHFEKTRGRQRARLTHIVSGARRISLEHDRDDRLVGVALPAGAKLRVRWDGARIVEVARRDASRGDRKLVEYRYDARGCLVEGRDGYQATFRFEYDASRRMTRKVDRRGYAFEFAYDADGRCVRSAGQDGVLEVRLEYRTAEHATIVTEATGGRWLYQYDAVGALLQIVDPLGGVRLFERDEQGQVTREVSPTGLVTTFEYDRRGALVARVDPDGTRIALPEREPGDRPRPHRVPARPLQFELGDLEALGFDAADSFPSHLWRGPAVELLRAPDTEPALGRPEERRDDQGVLLAVRRNGAQRTWGYDANGNVRRFTDFDGRTYRSDHASWNHRVAETDPLGRTVQLAYSKTEKLAAVVDPGGTRSEYVYDAKDRLVEVRRAGGPRDYYAYDLEDRLVEKRDAFGQPLLALSYDRSGRLAERRLTSGDVQRFQYDRAGRYLEAASAAGTVAFAYDAWGHRTRDARDGAGVEHSFAHDFLARTTVLGRFAITYTRDRDGSVHITDPTGGRHVLRHLAPGVWCRELADGVEEVSQFAPDGRCLFKCATTSSGTTAAWTRQYQYSAEGDLLAVRDTSRGATVYEHDEAHQLRAVRRDHGEAEPFVYDSASNLLAQPGLTRVTIGEGNRIYAANGDAFEYDRRHHLAKRWSYDGTATHFHHDSRDQLVRIDLPDGRTWEAEYDALGRRTKKRLVDGDTVHETTHYWDTDRLAAELLPDGKLRVYVYADDFAMVPVLFVEYATADADPESGRRYYLFTDHQGTPELVRDQDGASVWWARRDPYGVTVEGGHDFHQPFRFPGHWSDPETGLHYNRFRYFSPELGRFLQSDPDGVYGGVNVHAYPANPLGAVDVRGLGCPPDSPRTRHESEDASGTEHALMRVQPAARDGSVPARPLTGDRETRHNEFARRHLEATRRSGTDTHGIEGITAADLALARRSGDGPELVQARVRVARAFLGEKRWRDGERLGHDFRHPLFIGPPPPAPTRQGQYQVHTGVGPYYGDIDSGATPHDVGVHDHGYNYRTGEVLPKRFNVIEMTNGDEPYLQSRNAACFDDWSLNRHDGSPREKRWTYGGGVQRTYRTPPQDAPPRGRVVETQSMEHND